MLKLKWVSRILNTYEDWAEIKDAINEMNFEVAAFDTETTGLHIILDTPFLFQFGFIEPKGEKGYTFLIDLRYNGEYEKIIKEWYSIVSKAKVYLGHNVKFDLHMMQNIGLPYKESNLSDTQFYIRYSCDALHSDEGGPQLGLKDFSSKYIDLNAKYHEKALAKERSDIAKSYNVKLKNRLVVLGPPPAPFTEKSYTLSVINKMFKDPIFDESDLRPKVKKIYDEWKEQDLPLYLQNKVIALVDGDMIRYSDLNPETLYKYAHLDIVYTLEIYLKLNPILINRHNEKAVELENSLILPFFDMERTGFLADKKYLEESRIKIKQYIIDSRIRIQEMAGTEFKVGQHDLIKEIIKSKFNIEVPGTGNDVLENVKNDLQRNDSSNKLIEFIDALAELRTLEKWYSTYIMRFVYDLSETERLYTQIKSVGAVSGRVSSDFQQFPKEPIIDRNGNELFHPRRIVLVPNNCKCLLYLDYSQIELRFQAMYTILVGNPDLNMCRAYMPYLCHKEDGTKFDYSNLEHIKHWNDDWYTDESNEKWVPTDVHAATTEAAGYSKDDPEFKHYRKTIGKRVNFGKNYGASLNKIIEMFPEKSLEECKRIDAAYYTAFPGVKSYHQYCFNRAVTYPYTSNLFGIRFYNANGHKLRNLLVQGSAAHFLKYRIRALWEYIQENNLKSRMQMQIHDELVFEINKEDSDDIIKEFKRIMEDWNDQMIPIIAEAEMTTTNWAEKEEIEI